MSRKPDYVIFTPSLDFQGNVRTDDDGRERRIRIGAGWKTKTGGGINIQLEAHPIGGVLTIWPYQERES